MKLVLIIGLTIIISRAFVFKRYEIFGNSSEGYYTLPIYLGGESGSLQKQSMLIDTGSAETTIAGSECQLCLKRQLPFYNIANSPSAHMVKCGQKLHICKSDCRKDKDYCFDSMNYLDGSMNYGQIVQDKIRFSSEESDDEAYNIYFLYNTVEYYSSSFKPNGILGIGPYMSNILDWWFYRNEKQAIFTVCMGTNGGYLQLGMNQQIEQHDLIVQFDNSSQTYDIKGLKVVQFGDRQLMKQQQDNPINCMIDTGSSKTILPNYALQLIISQLKRICRSTSSCIYDNDSNCVRSYKKKTQLSLEALDNIFPDIQFRLQSDSIKMKPSQYFAHSQQVGFSSLLCLTLRTFDYFDNIILGIDYMARNRFQFNLDKNTVSIRYEESCEFQFLSQQKIINQSNNQDSYIYIISTIFIAITILLNIRSKLTKLIHFVRSLTKTKFKRQLQQQSTEERREKQDNQQNKQDEQENKQKIGEQSKQNVANSMMNSEIDSVLKVEEV